MEARFKETLKDIFRLNVPFERIYTTVFLIKTDGGAIIVDSATTKADVDEYLIPALSELACPLSSITTLVLTHSHSDHAGGAPRILELMPHLEVVTEPRVLTEGISTYSLPVHTDGFIGVLDERTKTLISGDGFQGAGVDVYRCYIPKPEVYIATIERVKADERVENLLFSHEYEPWFADHIYGRESVLECLDKCKEYV